MKFEGYSEDEIDKILEDIDNEGLKPYWEYPDNDIRNYFRSGKKGDLDRYSRKKPDPGNDPDGEPDGGDDSGNKLAKRKIIKEIVDSIKDSI